MKAPTELVCIVFQVAFVVHAAFILFTCVSQNLFY